MSEIDDDLDLSAWEAPEPPEDLADGVLARMAGTQVGDVIEPAPAVRRTRRAWVIGGTVVATLAAAAAVAVIVRGTERVAATSGRVVAEQAQTLSLGGVRAELDAGAKITWHREGAAIRAEQRAGNAAWRVEADQQLVIDAGATVASVEATGASLRVEVKMNSADMRVIGASALTAAAVAMVVVTVYEGHVKVAGTQGQPTVIVQPGSTYTVTPPAVPVVTEPPVVGASTRETVIPADVQVGLGETATIHVATVPVRIEIETTRSDCRMTLDGASVPSLTNELWPGTHPYTVACGSERARVGMLLVVDDAGHTTVNDPATAPVELMVRPGTTMDLVVDRLRGVQMRGGAGVLHVEGPAGAETFDGGLIPASKLRAGEYRMWFQPGAEMTLWVKPDPKAQIFEVDNLAATPLSGHVAPGTCVVAMSKDIPLAGDRFTVMAPGAVRFDHPLLGVHYLVVPPATVRASLSRDVIMKVVLAAKEKFRACAELTTRNGTVVFFANVAADGHVIDAHITQALDAQTDACVLEHAKKLVFPAAPAASSFAFPIAIQAPCDPDADRESGLANVSNGKHAAALVDFEASLACRDDPYVINLAVMAACQSKNAPKANEYLSRIASPMRDKLSQICIRNGVPLTVGESVPAGRGLLHVTVRPATGRILVDGVETGKTGKADIALVPGYHKVTFAIGDDRFTYAVKIVEGQSEFMNKDLQ